jgi:prephenate dehydrogenase
MFNTIAVFGLGLLGGSVCRRLKRTDPGVRIHAYGRDPDRLEGALSEKLVDTAGGFGDATLRGVDLAIVSTPVDSSIDIIRGLLARPDLGPSALVIDVGSVKEPVVGAVESHERADRFVGCHPMAGSEKMGYEFSRADLFEGASVIITPHARNRAEDVRAVAGFWEGLGAVATIVSPAEHDLVAAYTSHLPHMLASSLVRVFDEFRKGSGTADVRPFIGRGFLDTTRVSSGSPDMWRDIAVHNRENLVRALDRMIAELDALKHMLAAGDPGARAVREYLAGAKNTRDGLS